MGRQQKVESKSNGDNKKSEKKEKKEAPKAPKKRDPKITEANKVANTLKFKMKDKGEEIEARAATLVAKNVELRVEQAELGLQAGETEIVELTMEQALIEATEQIRAETKAEIEAARAVMARELKRPGGTNADKARVKKSERGVVKTVLVSEPAVVVGTESENIGAQATVGGEEVSMTKQNVVSIPETSPTINNYEDLLRYVDFTAGIKIDPSVKFVSAIDGVELETANIMVLWDPTGERGREFLPAPEAEVLVEILNEDRRARKLFLVSVDPLGGLLKARKQAVDRQAQLAKINFGSKETWMTRESLFAQMRNNPLKVKAPVGVISLSVQREEEERANWEAFMRDGKSFMDNWNGGLDLPAEVDQALFAYQEERRFRRDPSPRLPYCVVMTRWWDSDGTWDAMCLIVPLRERDDVLEAIERAGVPTDGYCPPHVWYARTRMLEGFYALVAKKAAEKATELAQREARKAAAEAEKKAAKAKAEAARDKIRAHLGLGTPPRSEPSRDGETNNKPAAETQPRA